LINDGIENLTTGLGTAKDQKTYTDFAELELTKDDIEKAYRFDWLFAKAVEIPAKDMTKKWLIFSGKSKHIEFIEKEYKRLKIKGKVRQALLYKSLYGASYIIIESEFKSLKSKLNHTDKIKKIAIFHKFNFPKDIHLSRIYTLEQNEFQDSLLYKLHNSILNLLTSLEIPASLMHKADTDFLSIKNLADILRKCKKNKDCQDAEQKILKRVQTMFEQLSLFKIGIKDTDENYESFTKDLSNYDNLQKIYMQIVAGAADIPLTRFFGNTPAGMNATGEGDLRNYHDSLSSMQDEYIEPFLELINDILFESNSINPKNFTFEFAPIRDLTPQELITIEKDKASIIAMFIDELDPTAISQAVSHLSVFKGINV